MAYVLPVNLANDVTIIVKSSGNGGAAIIPIAGDGVVGGIKPLYTSVYGARINRSGLVISEDGTTYINTNANRGVTRDGAGQIQINPATQEEVTAGEETYKPVTPASLAKELERRSYSTTPVRVGTWIDGKTSVWRVVIPVTSLEDLDLYSPHSTHQFDITTILAKLDIITDERRVIYINDRMIFTQGRSYNCGDYGDNVTSPGPGVYKLAATEYEGDTEAQYVYGWIEFATTEAN